MLCSLFPLSTFLISPHLFLGFLVCVSVHEMRAALIAAALVASAAQRTARALWPSDCVEFFAVGISPVSGEQLPQAMLVCGGSQFYLIPPSVSTDNPQCLAAVRSYQIADEACPNIGSAVAGNDLDDTIVAFVALGVVLTPFSAGQQHRATAMAQYMLALNTSDVRFSVTISTAPASGWQNYVLVASASTCDGYSPPDSIGYASVDLSGTAFYANASFYVSGFLPGATVNGVGYSGPAYTPPVFAQVLTLQGWGQCGGICVEGPLLCGGIMPLVGTLMLQVTATPTTSALPSAYTSATVSSFASASSAVTPRATLTRTSTPMISPAPPTPAPMGTTISVTVIASVSVASILVGAAAMGLRVACLRSLALASSKEQPLLHPTSPTFMVVGS